VTDRGLDVSAGSSELNIVGSERVIADQALKPPRATPLRARFSSMHEIAFTNNADKFILLVDHRNRADLFLQKELRDVVCIENPIRVDEATESPKLAE
jgi:hypothetical protein